MTVTGAVKRPWELARPYARHRRGPIVSLAGVLLVVTFLQVVSPQIVRFYIDGAVVGEPVEALIWIAGGYLVVAVVVQTIRVFSAYLAENLAWGMTNSLRMDLTRHCIGLDFRFHADHTPGELIERVDGDVTTLAKFLSSAFLVILSNLLLVTGIFVSLFFTDWRIGLVLLVYAGIALSVLLMVRGIALTAWENVRETSAALFGFLAERLSSAEDIRANQAQATMLKRLAALNDRMLNHQRTAMVKSNTIFTLMHGMYLLGYGGALSVGALLYLNGTATLGTVYLIIAYTNFIYLPLNEVRAQIQDMQRAMAGAKRVGELLAHKPQVPDGPGIELPPGPLGVELDAVSLRYDADGPSALRAVSLTVAPGEVLGITGRTGAGKTSLGRLVARMYDPTEGEVRIQGWPLRQARVADLRRRIAVVTQEVQILRGTVRDNVTLFDDALGLEEVEHAIENLGLGAWVRRLPDGVDTVVAGRDSMSAGEAQMLAICRAFLHDPGLVILDEISSRVDAETERMLAVALDGLLAGRTAIVIAHRPSTLERADRVIALENGEIVR